MQIEQISLSISAKTQKKVNAILKFFKSNKPDDNSKPVSKSYTQISKQNISISEIIKIKKAFPSIGAKELIKSTTQSKVTPNPNHASR